ncbi:MAG: hypothetical protein LC624_08285 [Halobacteriales archaeon]|nr:hypothetical protein [Halobacteriales archaeon]
MEQTRGEQSARSDLAGIEASLAVLHDKMDRLAEDAAVARTEIAWLKWGMRLLFAAVLGVGGVAAHAAL